MKNTPAVFLTSLAVSAISLTVPIPAATTVLDLFIGEDVTAQHITETNCEARQHTTFDTDGERSHQEYNTSPDGERSQVLRRQAEQPNFVKADTEAAFSLISKASIYYARSKRIIQMLEEQQFPGNAYRHITRL